VGQTLDHDRLGQSRIASDDMEGAVRSLMSNRGGSQVLSHGATTKIGGRDGTRVSFEVS